MFTTTVAVCGLFCLYYVYFQYVHICINLEDPGWNGARDYVRSRNITAIVRANRALFKPKLAEIAREFREKLVSWFGVKRARLRVPFQREVIISLAFPYVYRINQKLIILL